MNTQSIYNARQERVLTPAVALYSSSAAIILIAVLIVGPMLDISYRSWAEYYRVIGEYLRIWGYGFGIVFIMILMGVSLAKLLSASLESFSLRFTFIEKIFAALFFANLGWGALGILQGYPSNYVFGDTLRGAFIPLVYWIVKYSMGFSKNILSLVKVVLWGETLLLFVLVPLGFIPLSFGGRTFLTTIFFSLLFEERRLLHKIIYSCILLFGIIVIFTTQAQRGILIIFTIIILLNYIFRIREVRFNIVFFGFFLPALLLTTANELFELKLEKDIDVASQRFAYSLAGEKKRFGLDESLFQRAGEALDVGRSFTENSPIYFLSGFGNGAILVNKLITPSELSVYKTNKKHNIYITPIAILFRNGIIGVVLYSFIVWYIVRILFKIRSQRKLIQDNELFIYLKVLCLYQISVMLLSLIAYWYVGNIVVAFTLAMIEIIRKEFDGVIDRKQ